MNQSKEAKQRNEIARLTKKVSDLQHDKLDMHRKLTELRDMIEEMETDLSRFLAFIRGIKR